MTATPVRRADARRNRDRVLAAAQEAFAEEGILVPLDEIARRAGVGAGTVYRHFATKEALFAEVVTDRLERVVDEARELIDSADPGQAFFDFFTTVVERAAFNRAVCEALESPTGICPVRIEHDFDHVIGELLGRAQAVGAVRPDIDTADVRTLIAGSVAMERGRARPGRMVALMTDALRPSVTKPNIRNERCGICNGPLSASSTGRPARYCSPACRQKAHRRRRRTST